MQVTEKIKSIYYEKNQYPGREFAKRIQLKLNLKCNAKCLFCHFGKSDTASDLSTEEILKLLALFRQNGMSSLEISGGEPSLRPDLAYILQHAKETGFQKIILVTNGITLSNKILMRDLVKAGVDELVFTVLGHRAQMHEKHLMVRGSFSKLVSAINNAREVGVAFRSNTIITGLNYNYLHAISEFLLKQNIFSARFTCLNPTEIRCVDFDIVPWLYSFVAVQFQKAVNRYWRVFKKIRIHSIPFCFMQGYEQYVVNTPQLLYDKDGNNFILQEELFHQIQNQEMKNRVKILISKTCQRIFNQKWRKVKLNIENRSVTLERKVKISDCERCRYDLICDGIWRNYLTRTGSKEITPVPGEKITDPAFFMTCN